MQEMFSQSNALSSTPRTRLKDFFPTTTPVPTYASDVKVNISESLKIMYIEKIFAERLNHKLKRRRPIFTNSTNMTIFDSSNRVLLFNMTGSLFLSNTSTNATFTTYAKNEYTFANNSGVLRVVELGLVEINNVTGNLAIHDTIRNLTLTNISGNLTVKDVRGNLTLNNITGNVTITDSWGNLTAKNVIGVLTIDDIFGSVIVDQVIGNLSIDEAGGSTTIMNVTGHVIVDEVSGVMSIVNVSGNVFVIGVSGRLHVQNVTGNLTVIGVRHRGDLIVDDVKGDLTINDVIGNVQIGHVTGMLRQLNTIRRGKQWQRRYGDHHHYQVRHSYELEEDDEEDEKEDEDDEEEENEEDYEYEYEGAEQEDEDSEEEEESNEAHEDLQKYLFKNNCTTRFNATPEDVDILCYVNGSLTSRLLSDIDLGSSSSSSSSSSEEGDGKSEDDNSEEDQSGELERDSAMEDDRDGNLISEEGLLSNERLSELGNRTRQAGDNSTNKLHSDVYDTGLSEEYSSEELNIIGGIDVGSAPATHGEIRLNDEFPSTVCYHPRMVERITHPLDGQLLWSPTEQKQMTSAYYWGLLVSQLAGVRLVGVMGGKMLMLGGVMMGGILTLLLPPLATLGPYWVFTLRLLIGITQGVCSPAVHALLAAWAPPSERNKMVAFTYSGIGVGAAVGGPVAAWLVRSIGWESLFYLQGALAVLWCGAWYIMAHDTPHDHPRIGARELRRISAAVAHHHAGRSLPIPWGAIIRSKHVLAIILAQATTSWMWYTLYHHVPFYASTALHGPVAQVQVVWLAALMAGCVVVVAYAVLADWAINHRWTTIVVIRRAANSLCTVITVACLIGLAQAKCHYNAVLACGALALAIGMPAVLVAALSNSLDLAPNHAAVIQGIAGTAAAAASLMAPSYKRYLITGQATLERWRTLWYTVAIFLVLGNCLYFLLASAKEQIWNRPVMLSIVTRPGNGRPESNGISLQNVNTFRNNNYTSSEFTSAVTIPAERSRAYGNTAATARSNNNNSRGLSNGCHDNAAFTLQ
ncbi:uncharacterized protein LOC108668845 [Hyalella azteca]|uniref:Uncharacterized protein LOC108668845 n=1 Tax=Hyalella azteca TaxID=294128 RepID=A0A8B7NDB4_HYAAZ|nr:uncharacterized protein LOC108668845 [Hyalella azteca]